MPRSVAELEDIREAQAASRRVPSDLPTAAQADSPGGKVEARDVPLTLPTRSSEMYFPNIQTVLSTYNKVQYKGYQRNHPLTNATK
jgi:hypothetical protein